MDLWPEEIKESSEVLSPLRIIKEQASLLGKKTKNIVVAGVQQQRTNIKSNNFNYDFYIGSGVQEYRFVLFSFRYSYKLYPVYIDIDSDILAEYYEELSPFWSEKHNALSLSDTDEIIIVLGIIFKSSKTIKIINALLELSN